MMTAITIIRLFCDGSNGTPRTAAGLRGASARSAARVWGTDRPARAGASIPGAAGAKPGLDAAAATASGFGLKSAPQWGHQGGTEPSWRKGISLRHAEQADIRTALAIGSWSTRPKRKHPKCTLQTRPRTPRQGKDLRSAPGILGDLPRPASSAEPGI